MSSDQPSPRRSSIVPTFLMIAALAASCAVGGYYLVSSGGPSRMNATGFDVARVEARAPASSFTPAPKAAPQSSPMPIAGLQGMAMSAAPAPDLPRGQAGPAGPAQAASANPTPEAERAREKEFLAKHGAELSAYQDRVLGAIAKRHYQNDAVVRRVDAEFGALPRYMALKRQVDKDHDVFAFARGAIALPEVRAEIAKAMADPGVWKAAFGMINEALKNPPPKAIYDEAKHFMTSQDQITNYMAGEFTENLSKNKEAVTGALGPETDMSGIQKLASDIMPAGGAMGAMAGGALNPAALGAMGQPPKR